MDRTSVRSAGDALAYLTDCTLATVVDMHYKKKKPAGEFKRQISMAQFGVDQCCLQGVEYWNTRVADVVCKGNGSVEKWLQQKGIA